MSGEILKDKEVVKLSSEPSGGQVPQAPVPTTPSEPSGGQVPQASVPATQQASFYNPEKEIDRINKLMVGVVIFVVVSVLGTFFLLLFDFIKEKDLYLRYNDLYDNYSEKNSSLIEKINNQEIEMIKKEQRILELERDNKKLLDITDCLRNKKYWQYEQCFK